LLPWNEHYGKKEKRMERFFKYALPFLISIVAAMQFYQVVMRYIFEIPVMGLDEMIVYPTLWLYILGSVNAAREDSQIKANVLDVFLKTARARLIVRVIADFFSVVISSWLTYWAWDYFKYAKRVWKESPTLYIPTFWAECALFIGLVLMTLYCISYFIKNIKLLVAPLQTTEEI
jgi:TRAP-type C4-dicarboxylate transport system permease small subunit